MKKNHWKKPRFFLEINKIKENVIFFNFDYFCSNIFIAQRIRFGHTRQMTKVRSTSETKTLSFFPSSQKLYKKLFDFFIVSKQKSLWSCVSVAHSQTRSLSTTLAQPQAPDPLPSVHIQPSNPVQEFPVHVRPHYTTPNAHQTPSHLNHH